MIAHIPAADIDKHVSVVYPFLQHFEAETQFASAETLLEKIVNKERQLWAYVESDIIAGVVLTEVYETPRGRMLCAWAAAGSITSLDTFLAAYETIEAWAREIDCVAIEVRGRKGWKKMLPGFKEVGVLLEKSLDV